MLADLLQGGGVGQAQGQGGLADALAAPQRRFEDVPLQSVRLGLEGQVRFSVSLWAGLSGDAFAQFVTRHMSTVLVKIAQAAFGWAARS